MRPGGPPGGSPRDANEGFERVPPQNLDAEVSVLGAMLLSKDAIAEVIDQLGPEDFYRGAHRTLYEAMHALYERGEPVDPVLVTDELDRNGKLADVGGAKAVAEIVSRVPTAANAAYYARIVADHATRRRLINAGTGVVKLGYEAAEGADEAVDAAESLVFQVAQRKRMGEFTPLRDLLSEGYELFEQLYNNKSAITGLPTGFRDFDELTAGLQPANLVILAARPAMGKSTMVTNVAAHVAAKQRRPTVLFSLEMSKNEIVQRLFAAEAGVPADKLRNGRFAESDWSRLSKAMGYLGEAPLFIDDTAGITLMEIRAKCRRLKQKHGLDLVIVDYLQLMQSHRRHENRVQEVSELSRGLKVLAKELDVPVIALSQLSRKPEDRTDRRPQLADLRESGSIEQDADIVAFIYRDEVYNDDTAVKGEAELIVAKHRNGALGTIRLSFLGHQSRFADMARGPMPVGPAPAPL